MSAAVVEEVCTITAKGQTTVPKAVRQALGVGYGGRIAFRVARGRVTVHALPPEQDRDEAADPALAPFLALLEADLAARPAKACELFDAHQPCGAEANMAKYLAAKASWEAANACLQFHGGFGFASEYDVERKFRETRLYQVAPISTNLILSYVAEHMLGLPRSF